MALVDQIEMKIQRDRAPSRTKAYSASRHRHADGPGRPKVVIPLNQLQMLHDLNFTASQMAEQFQCSVQLIYKSLYDAGLKKRTRYSNLDDTALDEKIHELQDQYPNAGSVMMDGYLQTQGITMQRKRIRESMRRTSPFPVAHRLSKTIKRRKYSVAMSNSLWHVDGHMKLIRWGISTHGGIDGYSRLITFVKADTNNKATTVLSHFVGACIQFGVPSRVRSDHGGENVMIALFMNLINGQDRRSHITGRSVHNQRIERLWRDIFKEVIHKYYDLFYRMEDRGLLDIDK
ncbi:unnamed protein product [Mytilus coruscus]|uniref:Integrase core domain-containing protein n=1 Tax=Mytilus coruscus TaxID=42192 RepID=A0A6J8B5D5_MYTCO|nr:unnamed protein product [Mytilus coruscus]